MKKLILILMVALMIGACKKDKIHDYPDCELHSNYVFVYNDLEFMQGKWYDTLSSKTNPIYEFHRDYCIYLGTEKLYYIGVNDQKTVRFLESNYGVYNFRYGDCTSVPSYVSFRYFYENGTIKNLDNDRVYVKL